MVDYLITELLLAAEFQERLSIFNAFSLFRKLTRQDTEYCD